MDNEMDIMETELDDATNLVHLIQDYDWKSDLNIMSVRCAAHTLQLSILDTLKNFWNDNIIQSYIAIIEDARNVVKELRAQNNLLYLRKCGLPKPLIDCPTRWNSTHDMLERLLQLKTHCEECAAHGNPKLYLPMGSWKVIKEITVCLSPSKKAMKELQYENLTLTDIYKIWDICHFETAELGSPFSEDLLQNLMNSRNMMVEHDVFIAAVFLDPRFHFEMSSEQKEKAIRHLIWLHNRVSSLEEIQSNLETLSDTESTTSTGTDDRDLGELRYERILREKHRNLERNSKELPDFEIICRTFIPPRLKLTEKVIKFWKTNEDVYPSCIV